ncbi:hypothetical protein ABPG72_008360 [Tetrahymena utriculariae]
MIEKEYQEKIDQLEQQLKAKEKLIRENTIKFEKEKALLEQKREFYQLEVKELQQKINQSEEYNNLLMQFTEKKTPQEEKNEQMMKNFKDNIEELQENHKKQIESKDLEIKKQKDQYDQIIQNLNEKLKNEIENQSEKFLKQLESELQLYQQKIDTLNSNIQQQDIQIKALNMENKSSKENLIKLQEKELEKLKQIHADENKQVQEKFEQHMTQMKMMYEKQVKNLEEQIENEKCKSSRQDKDLQLNQEELYQEIYNLKEQKLKLEQEMQQMTNYHKQKVVQLEEHAKNLELIAVEKQQYFDNIVKQNESIYKKQISSLQQQNNELLVKFDEQVSKTVQLEKGNEKNNQLVQDCQDLITQEREELERLRFENSLKNQYSARELTELKSSQQQLKKENIDLKIQYEQLSVQSQEKEKHFTQLINDLNSKIKQVTTKYENQIQSSTKDHNQKLNDITEKYNKEKLQWEKNVQKLEKNLREVESAYGKQLSQVEKEAFKQKEQILSQSQQIMVQEKNISELNKLKDQLQAQNIELKTIVQSLENEIEKFKNLSRHFQEKYNQSEQAFNTQQMLNIQKINFLESQKERAKKDLADAQQKFQQVLIKMQSIRNQDKNEIQEGNKTLIEALERRYEQKISDLKIEYENQINILEQQLRIACLKNNTQSCLSKGTENKQIEELNELFENRRQKELQLLQDLQSQKQQYEEKISSQKLQYEQEIKKVKKQNEEELNTLKKTIQDLNSNLSQKQQKKELCEQQILSLNSQIQDLKKQIIFQNGQNNQIQSSFCQYKEIGLNGNQIQSDEASRKGIIRKSIDFQLYSSVQSSNCNNLPLSYNYSSNILPIKDDKYQQQKPQSPSYDNNQFLQSQIQQPFVLQNQVLRSTSSNSRINEQENKGITKPITNSQQTLSDSAKKCTALHSQEYLKQSPNKQHSLQGQTPLNVDQIVNEIMGKIKQNTAQIQQTQNKENQTLYQYCTNQY